MTTRKIIAHILAGMVIVFLMLYLITLIIFPLMWLSDYINTDTLSAKILISLIGFIWTMFIIVVLSFDLNGIYIVKKILNKV